MSKYTDPVHGFTFEYPTFLIPTTTSMWNEFGSISAENLVTIQSQSSGRTKYNDGPVKLSISVSPDPNDVGTCRVVPDDRPAGESSSVTINGVPFITFVTGDAAMGHYTNQKFYRTLHNNACYQLIEQTDSYRTETQEQSKGQQDSIAAAKAQIDPIIQSFRFTTDTSTVPPPTCKLSTDRYSYVLGDVITLKWSSQGARRALWDQPLEKNIAIRKNIVPPEDTPAVNGMATTIANIEGGYQSITLQVVGDGGFGTCVVRISVEHSTAKPSITVDSVRFTGPTAKYNNERYVGVTLSGTATNGALYNDELNIVLADASFAGPFDRASIYARTGAQSPFYSGGTEPGVREDSRTFKRWTAETYIPHGVTRVRVLAYPAFSATDWNSYMPPIINVVLDVIQ